MLKNKIAIVYGASGGIGGAVARASADQGVTLFLTGRDRPSVDSLAKDIVSSGGSAVPAHVDALDEEAVDTHLQSVIGRVGRVDISFNAVGIPNARILGVPLADLELGQFSLPITAYSESYFLTRAPCRTTHDSEQVRGDHDRDRIAFANRPPARRRLRSGDGRQRGAHSRPVRGAGAPRHFASSRCGHRACRRHARSGMHSNRAPRPPA